MGDGQSPFFIDLWTEYFLTIVQNTAITFSSTTIWVQIVFQIFQSLDNKKEIFKSRVTSIFKFEEKFLFSFKFSLKYFLFALYIFFASLYSNFFPHFNFTSVTWTN